MIYPKQPPRDDGKLVDLGQIWSTSQGESTNKQVNNASQAPRLGSRLRMVDAKARLCINCLNCSKDWHLEHVTGVKSKPPFWFIDELIDARAPLHLQKGPAINYPPDFDGYSEPM
jgi:hypothetical protein